MDSQNSILNVAQNKLIHINQIINQKRLACLIDDLEDMVSQVCIIKGDVLSLQAYGQAGYRKTEDIDILLPRERIAGLVQKLLEKGYQSLSANRNIQIFCFTSSHQLLPFIKIRDIVALHVDINFDILWGEYEGKRIDITEFLSDAVETNIYGYSVKTLPPLKSMVQLILHHYKDMNSIFLLATRKSIQYSMFRDIYNLLSHNQSDISPDRLYAISKKYEIIPYVFYMLYYTNQVFPNNMLAQYISQFRTPEGESLLHSYGLCAKERKLWKVDFQTRLEAGNLYSLIKEDLTDWDKEKIAMNQRIFLR